jgi:hypothetical protein
MADDIPVSEFTQNPWEQRRRSFATAELSDEKVQAIGASRMDERHAHLDAMLEPE